MGKNWIILKPIKNTKATSSSKKKDNFCEDETIWTCLEYGKKVVGKNGTSYWVYQSRNSLLKFCKLLHRWNTRKHIHTQQYNDWPHWFFENTGILEWLANQDGRHYIYAEKDLYSVCEREDILWQDQQSPIKSSKLKFTMNCHN